MLAKLSLPSYFEANQGQAGTRYPFLARLSGYTVLAGADGVTLLLPNSRGTGADSAQPVPLRLKFSGATVNRHAKIKGDQPQIARVNYYVGRQKTRPITGIATFAAVRYEQLYPGIDLLLRLTQGRLEYDLELAPGADPSAVHIETQGASAMRLDGQGNLHMATAAGDLTQFQPVIYQFINGVRTPVVGRFQLPGPNQIAFAVDDYRRDQALVIDPIIQFATYLGGDRVNPINPRDRVDTVQAVALDSDKNIIAVGQTTSVEFAYRPPPAPAPVFPAFQSKHGGENCLPLAPGEPAKRPDFDGFIAKFSPTGTLLYVTYLGGCGSDAIRAVALASAAIPVDNDIYVAGVTSSPDFPTSTGAFQSQVNGKLDGFVAKFSAATGQLIYSTYVGGTDDDGMRAIVVDSTKRAWATGYTKSADFPIGRSPDCSPPNPRVPTDLCLFGGGIEADAFLVRVAQTGKDLTYTAFLGGARGDWGEALAVKEETTDSGKRFAVLVAGETESGNFPLGKNNTPYQYYNAGNGQCRDTDSDLVGPFHPCRDAFVAKLTVTDTSSTYNFGTLLGGGLDEEAVGVGFASSSGPARTNESVESNSEGFWVAGNSRSMGAVMAKGSPLNRSDEKEAAILNFFPLYPLIGRLTEDVIAATGGSEPFLAKLSATTTNSRVSFLLRYSTFLGGTDLDAVAVMKVVSLGAEDAIYLAGHTVSRDFPTKNAFQAAAVNDDGFVSKIVEKAEVPATATPAKLDLAYSTLLGAEQADYIFGLANSGSTTVVAGGTLSAQFPITSNAFQATHGVAEDGFIVVLDDDDANSSATDVELTATTTSAGLALGRDIKLTLTATNKGLKSAVGPRVALEIPAGVAIVSNSLASMCQLVKRQLYCDIGDASTPSELKAGSSVAIVLALRPKFAGTVTLQASVLSRTADSNTGNNKPAALRINVIEPPNQGALGPFWLLILLAWGGFRYAYALKTTGVNAVLSGNRVR